MTAHKAAAGYATQLAGQNIRASAEPRNLNPPCVLFTPPTRVELHDYCSAAVQMRALLIVPGPGIGDAWKQADELLADVLAADVMPVEEIMLTQWGQADSPLPAYELTWTETVSYNTTPKGRP